MLRWRRTYLLSHHAAAHHAQLIAQILDELEAGPHPNNLGTEGRRLDGSLTLGMPEDRRADWTKIRIPAWLRRVRRSPAWSASTHPCVDLNGLTERGRGIARYLLLNVTVELEPVGILGEPAAEPLVLEEAHRRAPTSSRAWNS